MGCFSSPPSVEGEESSSSGASSSTSSDGPTVTTSGSSRGEASTGADASSSDATSSTSATSDDDDGSSSSTGEAPCGCDGDALLCESFEPPFDPDVSPWGVPVGGGSVAPTVVADPVVCGDASLRAATQPGDLYSASNYALGMQVAAGPHRVRAWIRMEASCTDAPTRILNLQLPYDAGVLYQWAIYTAPQGLELRMRNHLAGGEAEIGEAAFETGEWHELALDLDVTAMPPTGTVTLDGNPVIEGLLGPPLMDMAAFQRTQSLQFGIYRDDATFPNGCIAYYDDVRVTAL